MRKITWSKEFSDRITPTKKILAHLSLRLRNDQYKIFLKKISPKQKSKILDVGVTPIESLVDANFFEKIYPFKGMLTATTVESLGNLPKLYKEVTFKKITPGKRLPFKDKQFNIVVSWATLEHVGGLPDQRFFLSELTRVGKMLFVTTPNKGFFYELHSNLFLVHWLPNRVFRNICKILRKDFWSYEKNLNLLSLRDVKLLAQGLPGLRVEIYRFLGVLNTHILITKC